MNNMEAELVAKLYNNAKHLIDAMNEKGMKDSGSRMGLAMMDATADTLEKMARQIEHTCNICK